MARYKIKNAYNCLEKPARSDACVINDHDPKTKECSVWRTSLEDFFHAFVRGMV